MHFIISTYISVDGSIAVPCMVSSKSVWTYYNNMGAWLAGPLTFQPSCVFLTRSRLTSLDAGMQARSGLLHKVQIYLRQLFLQVACTIYGLKHLRTLRTCSRGNLAR